MNIQPIVVTVCVSPSICVLYYFKWKTDERSLDKEAPLNLDDFQSNIDKDTDLNAEN